MKVLDFKVTQQQQTPTKAQVDKHGNWIVLFPAGASGKTFPYGELLLQRRKKLNKEKADTAPLVTDLPNAEGGHVAYACIDPDMASFALLTLARKLVAAHKPYRPAAIAAAVAGFTPRQKQRLAEALVAAAAAAAAELPAYKKMKDDEKALKEILIYGVKAADGFRRSLAEAEGNALARYLSMLPPNKLTPADYLKKVRVLARDYGWKLDFYGINELKKKHAGAFLAVAQGSPTADAGILRLRYLPGKAARKPRVALVGKGICYDTGGTNLKPAKHMFGMHEDMQGSAVALGTLLALTKLRVRYPVECWLALAMNHIGPKAYKQNDVVTAADGTAIEVVHTDAEGRMVLADTLILASENKPGLIIDYATLTGACVYSLGTAYSGVFTNREAYITTLVKAGQDSGERVWPFPFDRDYDKALESDIADVKQCAAEGNADHILAARFLQRFVKNDIPWIHVDLSSSSCRGGLAHVPTDTTGFGVRYTLNLLLDKKII